MNRPVAHHAEIVAEVRHSSRLLSSRHQVLQRAPVDELDELLRQVRS